MEFADIPSIKEGVSRVGLGTWAIGGWLWGGTDEKESIATIQHALDLGVNLIDTAPVYGFGKSEEIVGKALKQYGKRDRVVVATKAGLSWKKQNIYRDAREDVMLKEIESSLSRLQLDYIDLYQLHWPDPNVPFQEIAETMEKLLKDGKIRAIGVSNLSVDQMEEFQKFAPIHSLQPPYNMFERGIEHRQLDYCLEKGIATLGYGTLCRGLLSGKMEQHKKFEGDDLRKKDPKFQEPQFSRYIECTKKLEQWSQEHYNKPLLALAVRWVLDKGISVALWGARHPEQMDDTKDIWDWRLTPSDLAEIDQILDRYLPSPVGPEFMEPPKRNS